MKKYIHTYIYARHDKKMKKKCIFNLIYTIVLFVDIKTRMQALTPGPGGGGSVRAVLTRMVQQEGLLRPIRGMSAMIAGAGPAHALYFSCYELIKNRMITNSASQVNHLVYGVAGCIATVLHDGIMNPAEG